MEKMKKAPEAARNNAEFAPNEMQHKDSDNQSHHQEILVFLSLRERPKTMLQVSKELGIYRANICRYVDNFRKANKVQVHHIGICPISKFRSGFLTTDKTLFRGDSEQLSLFDLWDTGGME